MQGELNLTEGERLKDEGISLVSANNQPWLYGAKEHIKLKLQNQGTVTADDLRDFRPPSHPNAIGAVFRSLSQEGYIKCVNMVNAKAKSAHARTIKVWGRA